MLNATKVQRRALSAAVMAPIVLAIIWYGGWVLGVLLGMVAGLALAEIWRMTKNLPFSYGAFVVFALYLAVGVLLCYHLRETYGAYACLTFFFAMWASDIGAYFSGKIIGGAKMTPEVSPNKTWAGYMGALIAPAILVCLFQLSVSLDLIVLGILLGITGQAGDLLVSSVKRDADLKNTGNLIPGHGGILDRIDSLIPAIAVFLAALKMGVL